MRDGNKANACFSGVQQHVWLEPWNTWSNLRAYLDRSLDDMASVGGSLGSHVLLPGFLIDILRRTRASLATHYPGVSSQGGMTITLRPFVHVDFRRRPQPVPRSQVQGPPEYGRSCDYSERVTMIAYYSLR